MIARFSADSHATRLITMRSSLILYDHVKQMLFQFWPYLLIPATWIDQLIAPKEFGSERSSVL